MWWRIIVSVCPCFHWVIGTWLLAIQKAHLKKCYFIKENMISYCKYYQVNLMLYIIFLIKWVGDNNLAAMKILCYSGYCGRTSLGFGSAFCFVLLFDFLGAGGGGFEKFEKFHNNIFRQALRTARLVARSIAEFFLFESALPFV